MPASFAAATKCVRMRSNRRLWSDGRWPRPQTAVSSVKVHRLRRMPQSAGYTTLRPAANTRSQPAWYKCPRQHTRLDGPQILSWRKSRFPLSCCYSIRLTCSSQNLARLVDINPPFRTCPGRRPRLHRAEEVFGGASPDPFTTRK
jgi:hypothetical protein